jgi:hypothetical protein
MQCIYSRYIQKGIQIQESAQKPEAPETIGLEIV